MSGLNSARSAWQSQRALAAVTGLVIMGSTPPADGDWPLPALDSGSFYVSSYSNDRVCLYASDGSFVRDFASPDLDGPRGIVVRSDRQELYVAGQNSDAIHVFDTSGNTLRTFSGSGLDGPVAAEHPPPTGPSSISMPTSTWITPTLLGSSAWSSGPDKSRR
ncbi:MAG: hypothetical protein IID37_06510 [Planctomycetes bacterium]|nr:hypothetical protein [Planctomycetota bacterium]